MADSATPPKRFVPEPVETTTKSRRAKFAPQPVETSGRSTRAKPSPQKHELGQAQVSRRFSPVPVETSKQSNRPVHNRDAEESAHLDHLSPSPSKSSTPSRTTSGRSFAPQLIETSRLSRKSTDEGPTLHPADRTDGPSEEEDQLLKRRNRRRAENGMPAVETSRISGRSTDCSPLRKERSTSSGSRASGRQHSFRIPDLDPIESSESEKSICPSLSTSPSASSDSSANVLKHSKKMRESCDDGSSGYLLELAAKAAEKQLREQALAAFPNDDFHEPVDHFAVDRESDESDEQERAADELSRQAFDAMASTRRESEADISAEVRTMRQQKEKAQNLHHTESKWAGASGFASQAKLTASPFRQGELVSKHAAVATADRVSRDPKNVIGGWQKGVGLQSMKNAAAPPMLGNDITFRMSQSPRPTKLDPDHGPVSKSPKPGERAEVGGLWMGYCFVKGGQPSIPRPPQLGLKTPRVEKADPFSTLSFEGSQTGGSRQNSPPARRNSQPTSPGKMTLSEEEIDREFPDSFVTQVYNYLSLGFPSLARKFDGELSKISRISVDQLENDDGDRGARGFVGLDDDHSGPIEVSADVRCGRWHALRLYIREWARQNPEMASDGLGVDAWGVRARRGSWAI
ncbi:MAG: hypothetical protein M4579_000717 [Chaenotheca gracillima]|nr:MAG: hypothetical protein M4579_000717 [Chaenotheca gracillima]